MRVLGIASALLLAVACGRTPLLGAKAHDGGAPGRDSVVQPDTGTKTPEAADGAWGPDGRDSRTETGASVSCSALARLASRGVLTASHAKQVLFAKDRSSLVLRVSRPDTGSGDDVMLVRLPGGETSNLGAGAVDLDWLDDGSRVLVRKTTGDLLATALEGGGSTTLARGTCEHLTSPDGTRVLASLDCDALSATLASIDTRTGVRTDLGRTAGNQRYRGPNVVFSPSGEWLAFLEPSPAADGSVSYAGTVYVVDRRNRAYALKSAPGASNLTFASDTVLLFTNPKSASVDVRAHQVGSGDVSRVIARGVDLDGSLAHLVSPDGQWALAAIIPVPSAQPDYAYALSAFGLDGREVALATDLFPYHTRQMLWHSSSFAADNRHVVYASAGPPWGSSVVDRTGGLPSPLSADQYSAIPPTGNLVALTETCSQPMRVRLTNLDTVKDVAVAETTARPSGVTFTPDGQSVLFVEEALPSAPARLQHLSGRTGARTELARWAVSQLVPSAPCCNEPGPGYPIDPTGCFTVVDSDLGGGTSLILLPEAGAPP